MSYWFSAQVRDAIASYLGSPPAPAKLLWLSGKKMKVCKTLPSGISSTGTKGHSVSTQKWKSVKGMNRAPVNVEMLGQLRDWSETTLQKGGLRDDVRKFIERLRDVTVKVIRMEATDLAGPGHIQQVYAIAPAGRLPTEDGNTMTLSPMPGE